ncbi:radical S-adenosyl methionine domain-containing protein 1, mitochondrial isoform X3 [Sciurus carolinensis]|uniref:radical S-adenosyl methionine domain-containing protein 1, mitochondrial isoform X3 n=1 Tax=Sciurus carolinensis TaxID=30640 RepID=UPI001FB2DB6C|nr:radical S-adenosyl methionine domain-containing protein 1, mitochondrial isoform X3 [Sciurus carolinensis]
MVLPAARARGLVAAAKAAQRRRRVDSRGGSPSPEPASRRAAVYVHWPYCEKRCSYCNFNKYIPRGVEEAAMRNCLVTESLDDTELQLLGRTHSSSDALRTLAEARCLFPGRVSVDLMLGLPAQQVGPWLRQLQELLHHCDDHLSLYQLSLERGTALFAQVQQGALPAPDPELATEMYQEGRAMLQEAGFRQYEVSNFARNGALSTHNWTYWQCGQYLGIGPGAHGRFMLQGAEGHTREARIQTLEPDNWMKEVMLFGHGTRKRVPLGKLELDFSFRLEEALAMGLRTDVGLTHQHWQEFEPPLTLWDIFGTNREVKELLEQDLLLLDHRGLRCSWKGLAVLDSLLLTLLPQLQKTWHQRTPSLVPGG